MAANPTAVAQAAVDRMVARRGELSDIITDLEAQIEPLRVARDAAVDERSGLITAIAWFNDAITDNSGSDE